MPVKQRTKFGVRWILDASKGKLGKTVEGRLAREMEAVVRGESEAMGRNRRHNRFAMVNRYAVNEFGTNNADAFVGEYVIQDVILLVDIIYAVRAYPRLIHPRKSTAFSSAPVSHMNDANTHRA
jgi:hypothetical protein